jgi:hypothetical protein
MGEIDRGARRLHSGRMIALHYDAQPLPRLRGGYTVSEAGDR